MERDAKAWASEFVTAITKTQALCYGHEAKPELDEVARRVFDHLQAAIAVLGEIRG